jgi:uncharacterized damage-inducible protein DinB
MKIESPSFTVDDVIAFMDTYLDRERNVLADRLQTVSDRLAALAPRISKERSEDGEWTAHEVLAHIAAVSKYYGVLMHRVASGKFDDLQIMEAVKARDSAADRMAELEGPQLLEIILADQARTIDELRHADLASLRRTARLDGDRSMSAEEVARLPLVSHLETHIEQLERLLGG